MVIALSSVYTPVHGPSGPILNPLLAISESSFLNPHFEDSGPASVSDRATLTQYSHHVVFYDGGNGGSFVSFDFTTWRTQTHLHFKRLLCIWYNAASVACHSGRPPRFLPCPARGALIIQFLYVGNVVFQFSISLPMFFVDTSRSA